jgi:ArsR family transcriptional regulator, arsenate/arsenite/antimonite-responsive transcriptional repressor
VEVEVAMRGFDECCAPLTSDVLDETAAVELAEALKVLADPARLRLLSLVAAAESGEACACDLTEPLGRSQPTVSHHLSVLVDAGFLSREKRGRWAWFRLERQRLQALGALLDV